MTYSPLLPPVVVLVAWTLVIMAWMAITRFGAFQKMGVSLGNIPPGSRGVNLEGKAPDEVQWKSHNYNHLMEQPTLFYAVALTLALLDFGGGINLILAWLYVLFRIGHSLVQATVNRVQWRFLLFLAASFCLVGLTVHSAAFLLHDLID